MENFELSVFENREYYIASITSTTDCKKCMGELVYQYSQIIQRNSNKDEIIGNGIQITDSIFVRVIPYAETKAQFFSSLQN